MYEVHALRYATFEGRLARENFISGALHDGPMPLDYFVWVIRGGGRTVVVDTGFEAEAGRARNRRLTIAPADALRRMGVDPADVGDVVITHLHYDHAGHLDAFPRARFHLQEREMRYATGPCMCHKFLRHPFEVEPVVAMVRCVHADRVVFHSGRGEVLPGIELELVGGHSDGLQIVSVETQRGRLVLASDAMHFYANAARQEPFPLVFNVGDMIEGWRRVARIAAEPSLIIPGHDPAVAEAFRRVDAAGLDIFKLHEAPLRPVPFTDEEFASCRR